MYLVLMFYRIMYIVPLVYIYICVRIYITISLNLTIVSFFSYFFCILPCHRISLFRMALCYEEHVTIKHFNFELVTVRTDFAELLCLCSS